MQVNNSVVTYNMICIDYIKWEEKTNKLNSDNEVKEATSGDQGLQCFYSNIMRLNLNLIKQSQIYKFLGLKNGLPEYVHHKLFWYFSSNH